MASRKYNPEKSPLVEMTGVSMAFQSQRQTLFQPAKKVLALNSIDLSIQKGEIFGLVGQSGSGKTTAGRLLVRLEEPTSGEIRLKGESIAHIKGRDLKTYHSKVQMIFQDPYQSLNPHLSVSQTIMEPLTVHHIGDRQTRKEKVLDTLETVGLAPGDSFYDRYPHQLSGGQRQRVAVARAIVLDPEFIVADEPTSMLDATIAIQLFKLLFKIRKTLDMTFLFITHNLAAAKYLCDRIAVIHEGHIVEVNTADNIIRRPEHPYTKKLIRVQPSFSFKR